MRNAPNRRCLRERVVVKNVMLKNSKDGTPLQPNKGDGIEQATELTVAADKSINIYIDNAQQILQQNAQCSQFGLFSSFNN